MAKTNNTNNGTNPEVNSTPEQGNADNGAVNVPATIEAKGSFVQQLTGGLKAKKLERAKKKLEKDQAKLEAIENGTDKSTLVKAAVGATVAGGIVVGVGAAVIKAIVSGGSDTQEPVDVSYEPVEPTEEN